MSAKRRQDRDNRQLVCLLDFLMNIGEFVERRKAVKESLRLDKLLTLCIFGVESRILADAIASAARALARDFLVKFVERREAVKEQLGVDMLLTSCIFAVESRVHMCTRVRVLV